MNGDYFGSTFIAPRYFGPGYFHPTQQQQQPAVVVGGAGKRRRKWGEPAFPEPVVGMAQDRFGRPGKSVPAPVEAAAIYAQETISARTKAALSKQAAEEEEILLLMLML